LLEKFRRWIFHIGLDVAWKMRKSIDLCVDQEASRAQKALEADARTTVEQQRQSQQRWFSSE
jgi:hypothetical protein